MSKSIKIPFINPTELGLASNWINKSRSNYTDADLAEDLVGYLPGMNKDSFLKSIEDNRKQLRRIIDRQLADCLTIEDRHMVKKLASIAVNLQDPEGFATANQELYNHGVIKANLKVSAKVIFLYKAICNWLDTQDEITYSRGIDVDKMIKEYISNGFRIDKVDCNVLNLNYGHNRQTVKEKLLPFLYILYNNLSYNRLGGYVYLNPEYVKIFGKLSQGISTNKDALIAICRQFGILTERTKPYKAPFVWSAMFKGEDVRISGECTKYYINIKNFNKYNSSKFTYIKKGDNIYMDQLIDSLVEPEEYITEDYAEYVKEVTELKHRIILYKKKHDSIFIEFRHYNTHDIKEYSYTDDTELARDLTLLQRQGYDLKVKTVTKEYPTIKLVHSTRKAIDNDFIDRVTSQLNNIVKSYCCYDDYVKALSYIEKYNNGVEDEELKSYFGNIYQARIVVAINEKDITTLFKYTVAEKSKRLYHKVTGLKKNIRHKMFDSLGYQLVEVDLGSSIATLLPYVLSEDFIFTHKALMTENNQGIYPSYKEITVSKDLSRFNFNVPEELFNKYFSYPMNLRDHYESIYFCDGLNTEPTSELSKDTSTGNFYKLLAVKAGLISKLDELTDELKADIKLAFMKLVNGHKAYKFIKSIDSCRTLLSKVWYAICTYDNGYLAKSINYCKVNGIDLANMVLLAETEFISYLTKQSRDFILTIHDSIKLPINKLFELMDDNDRSFDRLNNPYQFVRITPSWKLEYNNQLLGID